MKKTTPYLSNRKLWVIRLFVFCCVGLFFSLNVFDKLIPLRDLLAGDQLAFQIGDMRLTLYFLLKSLIVLSLFFWLGRKLISFGVQQIRGISGVHLSNKLLMVKVFQFGAYLLSFLIILDILGINLTVLTVFSGAIGIGVGFGLQKIAANFISGLILLFEKSIETGDLVELGDGTFGFVDKMGARYMLILTFDGKEIMMPNEEFISGRVINWTFSDTKARIDIGVGVAYASDLKKVKELILAAASEHSRCMKNPAPECFLTEFADSSVNFLLLFWVEDVLEGRYGPKSDVLFSIWEKFKKHDIEIPFPQQDLYVKNLSELKHSGGLKV